MKPQYVNCMSKTNVNNIALRFFDFALTPDELTKELGLNPTETALKGQKYFQGPPDNNIEKIWPYNYWEYRVTTITNDWVNILIDDFFNTVIKPGEEKIKLVTLICQAEFSIVQYSYDGYNPGFHIDKEKLKILGNLGIELDIDIYCLENAEGEK